MTRIRIWCVFILSAALWLGCGDDSTGPCNCGDSRWPLADDSMNLAVLVSDFESYDFEKGALNFYEPCGSCDTSALPFDVIYRAPADFGDIAFEYNETGDTLFYGTLVWLGQGEILFPRTYFGNEQFKRVARLRREPLTVKYFNIVPQFEESVFEAAADSAWREVRTLDIVDEFAKKPYRVGIYLYAPALGVFDPSAAKWIVFVYRGRTG
ncbi:MAG: hypothetical protein P8181_08340 [bacterium]